MAVQYALKQDPSGEFLKFVRNYYATVPNVRRQLYRTDFGELGDDEDLGRVKSLWHYEWQHQRSIMSGE